MYLADDLLTFGYLIGTVVLVPLDPALPHLNDLLLLELSRNRKSGDGNDVGVELFLLS
jgi:hypothetical protein